jgi:hypothetical protein
MQVTQKTRARILCALLLISTAAFIGVPLIIGGHPGEPYHTSR